MYVIISSSMHKVANNLDICNFVYQLFSICKEQGFWKPIQLRNLSKHCPHTKHIYDNIKIALYFEDHTQHPKITVMLATAGIYISLLKNDYTFHIDWNNQEAAFRYIKTQLQGTQTT